MTYRAAGGPGSGGGASSATVNTGGGGVGGGSGNPGPGGVGGAGGSGGSQLIMASRLGGHGHIEAMGGETVIRRTLLTAPPLARRLCRISPRLDTIVSSLFPFLRSHQIIMVGRTAD